MPDLLASTSHHALVEAPLTPDPLLSDRDVERITKRSRSTLQRIELPERGDSFHSHWTACPLSAVGCGRIPRCSAVTALDKRVPVMADDRRGGSPPPHARRRGPVTDRAL